MTTPDIIVPRITIPSALRVFRLTEVKEEPGGKLVVNSDDLIAALKDRTDPYTRRDDIALYVPYIARARFEPGKGAFRTDVERAQKLNSLGVRPKELLGLLKHSTLTLANGMTATTQPSDVDVVLNRMATKIARAIGGHEEGVDLVTYPESSSDMAQRLAARVAELLDAPLVDAVTVKRSAAEVEVDPEEMDLYRTQYRDAEEVNSRINKTIKGWRKTNRIPATKGLQHPWRRFVNLHKPGKNIGSIAGKVVLVVDDNVDRAYTLGWIERTLRTRTVRNGVAMDGARHVYLAAGWDYSGGAIKKPQFID